MIIIIINNNYYVSSYYTTKHLLRAFIVLAVSNASIPTFVVVLGLPSDWRFVVGRWGQIGGPSD